jgi:hypothetical protein
LYQSVPLAEDQTSSTECLGLHLGDLMPANLGDGDGWVNQTIELCHNYGSSGGGTCLKSLVGGNHFWSAIYHGCRFSKGLTDLLNLKCLPSKWHISEQRCSVLGYFQGRKCSQKTYHYPQRL